MAEQKILAKNKIGVSTGHENPSAPHHDPRALQDPRDRLQHQFEGESANSGTSSTLVKNFG